MLEDGLIERKELSPLSLVNFVAPVLLLASLAWCVSSGFIREQKLWAAAVVWGAGTLALVLQWSKTGVIILAVGLLAAIFHLLMFFPISFDIGLRPDPGGYVSLDFIPFLLIIVLALTNQETVRSISLLFRKELAHAEADNAEARTNRFIKTFSHKSNSELEAIVSENRLVPEAIQAAMELLKTRGKM